MNRYLIVKLLSITLLVILFVVVLVWISIDTLAAGYFVTLMEKYHISPEPAHDMFVSAIHRYLIWTFLGGVILAAALSYLMMRRVLKPLTRMTDITQDIAAGDFSVRVPPGTADEVGRLAKAFNLMAESLEKLEKLRRNLMIDVAHELRTPLTNIRGYLEALTDKVVPPTPQTFTLLMDETMRLATLVEDVLQLARADASHGKLQIETLDVTDTLRDAVGAFSAQFQKKDITLHLEVPPDPVIIPADRDRLIRVLRNLTDNAARYAPAGSDVSIRLTAAPDADQDRFLQSFRGSDERGFALSLRAILPGRKIPIPGARRRRHRAFHRQGTRGGPRGIGGRIPCRKHYSYFHIPAQVVTLYCFHFLL